MNDFIAGPASGANSDDTGPWSGGTPPPVLLAALGAAALIAILLVAFLVGSGGGGGGSGRPVASGSAGVDDPGQNAASNAEKRVLLTISIEGGGTGRVHISPLDVTCTETCEHEFVTGTRVNLSAKATTGSRFEGWDEACTGPAGCAFFMDREREVTATFEGTPAANQCDDGKDNDGDGLIDDNDPGCRGDNTEAPDNRKPANDCSDGIDNDGDGLVDSAQDPGCSDGTEADSTPPVVTTTPVTTTPVTTTPANTNQCNDGIDNDGDGLVDKAQDPGCATGTTESGAPATGGAATGASECSDGRDNDGDGLTDRPADPGCDADGTEAGG